MSRTNHKWDKTPFIRILEVNVKAMRSLSGAYYDG